MLINAAKIMNNMLKYLKWLSFFWGKKRSINLVLATSKVQGKTVILPKRYDTSTIKTVQSDR